MSNSIFRTLCKEALHDLNTHSYLSGNYPESVKDELRALGAHECKGGLCMSHSTIEAEAEGVFD